MTIIFSPDIKGHFLEYLHHIYEVCINSPHEEYVFYVGEGFKDIKSKFHWPDASNISFEFIPYDVVDYMFACGPIKRSYYFTKYVKQCAKRNHARRVFSTALISLLPFAPFMLPSSLKLSGIIYMIYLHSWSSSSFVAKFENVLKYLLMSYSRTFGDVYILNDSMSAKRLNKLYHVSKYKSIVDPYVPLENTREIDLRTTYNIDPGSYVFSHFGALNRNKGTLEVLKSIAELTDDIKQESYFIIAGRVDDDIADEYNSLISHLHKDAHVILENHFCSYEYLANLCRCSNALVVPYKRTSQSSGVIGYASQFGVPVIAPNKGLLGQLVKQFELGLLIDNCESADLISSYRAIITGNYQKPTQEYCRVNTVKNFQETLKISIG